MAGAPRKKGLDYLQLDVGINQDTNVELLEAEFGLRGFALFIKLLIRVYEDEGYFMEWNKDTQILLAKRIGESESFVEEVVNKAVSRGLFNVSIFNKYGVLTSSGIQERYFNAIKRRERVTVIDEYLLVDKIELSNTINVFSNSINACNNTQSREEESRAEKSKVEDSRAESAPARMNPVKVTPPESAKKVIEIGNMRGIPPANCEVYFDLRSTDNFMRQDKHGNWKPILNWHADLSHLNRKGALDTKRDGNTRKTKGDRRIEQLRRYQ